MITCANWSNIWLNEGFATYSTAVYNEGKYGSSSYWSYVTSCMNSARNAVGSIYIRDTLNLNTLFNWNLVYAKGATVLHMLRHVLGDSAFFRSIRAYANDSRFRFGVATTENFKQVCETVFGTQLSYFFDEWIYGEKYPQYTYSWQAIPDTDGGYIVPIRIRQTTGTANPTFFTMPVDFRLAGIGLDTTVVLMNTLADQTFNVHVPLLPTTGQLDPNNWILKTASPAPTITPAMSDVLYGASSNLYTVSRDSGIATIIGLIGPHPIQGLAIRPTTRELYGVSPYSFGTYLHRISSATGAGLFERTLMVPNMRAIAFSAGDTLFGATTAGSLYRIDLTTGAATAIGTSTGRAYSGLSFSPVTKKLWASLRQPFDNDSLFTIDRNNGTATFAFKAGWPTIVPSIAFSPEDTLYGLLDETGGYLARFAPGSSQIIGETWAQRIDAIAMYDRLVSVEEQKMLGIPLMFALEQNYPNPFNPTTEIRYQIPEVRGQRSEVSRVTLKVFDILGREVATLVDEVRQPGTYNVQWNASGVASGVYLYRLRADAFVETKKCLMLR
ncbi:MAG: T9SS type A sorting domain-containing protein [Ignavibacteriae bacterium]|nr:T9SS type A sorting domain-containing protein [Ignavibacteriota bacterium]